MEKYTKLQITYKRWTENRIITLSKYSVNLLNYPSKQLHGMDAPFHADLCDLSSIEKQTRQVNILSVENTNKKDCFFV